MTVHLQGVWDKHSWCGRSQCPLFFQTHSSPHTHLPNDRIFHLSFSESGRYYHKDKKPNLFCQCFNIHLLLMNVFFSERFISIIFTSCEFQLSISPDSWYFICWLQDWANTSDRYTYSSLFNSNFLFHTWCASWRDIVAMSLTQADWQ